MSAGTLVEVELLSGCYHAHVWGEAQFGMAGPEWPPSPWRLLRALAAVWFEARPKPSSESARDALLQRLGRSDPPEIWLPQSSFHETRYYQPIRVGSSDRVLHHDHYAVPEGGRFWFRFEVELPREERELLAKLLGRLRYFGRSESRATLRLAELAAPPSGVERIMPRDQGMAPDDAVYRWVLCTTQDFQASDLWSLRSEKSQHGYPAHLVETLLSQKMPLPTGTRWVDYAVPTRLLVSEIRPRINKPARSRTDVLVAEIHFRLSRRTPIPILLLVAVARAFRDTAVQTHRALTGGESKTLSGLEPDGSVARGHQHAYYLPQLAEGRPHVEKLVVRIPTGRLTPAELDALLAVERIRVDGSPYSITVVPERLVPELQPPEAARRWQSATPFLLPWRRRGSRIDTCIPQQVAAWLARHYGLRPTGIEPVRGRGSVGEVSGLLSHRYGTPSPGASRHWTLTRRLGFWIVLTFDQPAALGTPIGADAHFGAGQFEPG